MRFDLINQKTFRLACNIAGRLAVAGEEPEEAAEQAFQIMQAVADRMSLGAKPLVPGDLAGKTLREIEHQAIHDTLALTNGNRKEAAQILGIGERTLYRRLNEDQDA